MRQQLDVVKALEAGQTKAHMAQAKDQPLGVQRREVPPLFSQICPSWYCTAQLPFLEGGEKTLGDTPSAPARGGYPLWTPQIGQPSLR